MGTEKPLDITPGATVPRAMVFCPAAFPRAFGLTTDQTCEPPRELETRVYPDEWPDWLLALARDALALSPDAQEWLYVVAVMASLGQRPPPPPACADAFAARLDAGCCASAGELLSVFPFALRQQRIHAEQHRALSAEARACLAPLTRCGFCSGLLPEPEEA